MSVLLRATLFLLALSAPLLAPEAQTEDVPSDPRVVGALEALSYTYSVANNGDYALTFNTENERKQVVWVRASTTSLSEMEMREVFSIAYEYPGEVPPEVAATLLQQNTSFVIGAWAVEGSRIAFIARVPADASTAVLDAALAGVMFTADGLEATLGEGADGW